MTTIESLLQQPTSVTLSERKILLGHILNFSKLDLIKKSDQELTVEIIDNYFSYLKRRELGEPIAYICELKEFYSYSFKVTSDVLIPRPETEQIIDIIKKEQSLDARFSVLDLGTGSGCIGITLAKEFSNAAITAVDISAAALDLAQLNAEQLETKVDFYKSDLLTGIPPGQSFNYIVANLPYIDYADPEVSQETRNYEPDLALFSDNDGLSHYERFFAQLSEKNIDYNKIIIEVGHKQKTAIDQLCKKYFTKSGDWRYDLQGIPRICII